MPDSFAESSDGLLLVANGVDSVLRWDSLDSQAEPAGVIPPSSALTLSGSGLGGIVGTFYAYTRFVDRLGNFSNLSPLSNAYTAASTTGVITGATNAAPVVITSAGHSLITGTRVAVSGVEGNTGANGTWVITRIDADTFSLDGSAGTDTYLGAGTWSAGVGQVSYAGVPTSSEPKVARRQILRNTAGQTQVFYVDVDTDDLTSSSFTSTLTDALLSAQPFQALFDPQGRNIANFHTVPPSHKAVLAQHLDRMFLACEVPYSEGCVSVTFGGLTVRGVGTEWSARMAGRALYVVGATESYTIDAVDVANQVLTLASPYRGPTDPYPQYAIRALPDERRIIYYSEAGEPESWPATNTLSVQEDADELTGLMPKGSFLYILERHHIYRFTFQSDPAADGYVFLSANRGCVNNRCWVLAEDVAYMLDESGCHAFSGGQESEPISTPVQDLFESEAAPGGGPRINWAARSFFHAAHHPAQCVVRWFVALSGSYLPRHALCYDYRLKRWWVEEFPFDVGSSCLARLEGKPKVFLGGPAGMVFAYGVGTLDGPDPRDGTVRGAVTSATPTGITDSAASFPASGVVGSPVVIVSGRGKGQVRVVASVSGTTLGVTQPWLTLPDATSTYQLGGVQWSYRTGWFRWAESEQEEPRRLEIAFEPCAGPCTLDANLYVDRSRDPLTWDSDYSSSDSDGFASAAGSADLTADLTKRLGFVQKRLDDRREFYADGARYIQLGLGGVSNEDPVTVHQVVIDGARPPGG